MKKVLIALIIAYQKVLSPDTGFIPRMVGRSRPTCIYYPTCSAYAKEAIEKYGVFKGSRLAVRRIGRCNPFHEPRVDLVP